MAENEQRPVPAAAQDNSRANLVGQLDFIETEEDVKAVESAALKIQSTFRGKKVRTFKAKPEAEAAAAAAAAAKTTPNDLSGGSKRTCSNSQSKEADELSSRVGKMDVNDDSKQEKEIKKQQQQQPPATAAVACGGGSCATQSQATANLSENEADRAATKIQAGFKGYKTRKELEGKLGAGQQAD